MIETKVKEQEQEDTIIDFPCIRRTRKGVYVLFSHIQGSTGAGTVIVSSANMQPVGYYSGAWTMKEFFNFKGSIILEST